MPYVIVNKKNVQFRDVIVAATSWIANTNDGISYVYLPKANCDRVKEFLEKETLPLEDWEKHACDILIRNIPTLGSAYKAIEMVRKRGVVLREDSLEPQFGVAIAKKRLKVDTVANGRSKEIPVTVYESLSNEDDGHDMFLFSDTDNIKEDPFGDVVPPLEQPLPVLPSGLTVKPRLPATITKPNENVSWIAGSMVHAEKDPLGDVSTPPISTSKPIIVHIPTQLHTRSKPTPPATPTVVNVPEFLYTASNSTLPATTLLPAPPQPSQLPQIPKSIAVVVKNQHVPGKVIKDNVIVGKVVGSKVITTNVVSGKAISGNVNKDNVCSSADHTNELSTKNDNQSPQLQNLLCELKSMIISNQAEIKRQVYEGFKQMQHSLMQLLVQQNWEPSACQNPECAKRNRFTFNMLRTIEEMQRFEEQLKDVEYRTKLHSAIIDTLKSELDGSKRMDRMFSLLFDTVLHTQLSWSVQFGKEPLRSYINITKLFEFIATTTGHSANVEEVVTFFKHKLDTSNVPCTTAIEPLKPTTSVSVVVNNNSNTFLTIENVPETSGTQPISAVECKIEPDVSMESRDEESNQSSTDNPGTSSGPSQRKTFITSMDKMDRFEKQLSDKKIQQQVYKWVDKTFGHEPDMEKRLQQLLNRLMDVRVFQHFKWKVHAGGHRRMIEYPNFIGLFEHACRTVEGDTAVLNTELVAKFFNKQLAYTQQRKRQYKLAKTNEHTFKLANKEKTWNDLA